MKFRPDDVGSRIPLVLAPFIGNFILAAALRILFRTVSSSGRWACLPAAASWQQGIWCRW